MLWSKKRQLHNTDFKNFLTSRRAGKLLPMVFLASIPLYYLLETLLSLLTRDIWQVSGYYLAVLKYGFLLAVAVLWLFSILLLFFQREYAWGLLRLASLPLILFMALPVLLFSRIFLPSTISSYPIDAVYSNSRHLYYILAFEPVPTDVCYRVFSAKRSLFNPVWKVEFTGNALDYSEDGSLTKNPHLILSKDEELLVIGRGGELTDALLLDTRQPLVPCISWTDENRESEWAQRTELIQQLLQRHETKGPVAFNPLTYPQIRSLLTEYGAALAEKLRLQFQADHLNVSCTLKNVDWNEGKIRADYIYDLIEDQKRHSFFRSMEFAEDHGKLVITEQDNGLSWSSDEEKALCERLRDILEDISGPGTYIE